MPQKVTEPQMEPKLKQTQHLVMYAKIWRIYCSYIQRYANLSSCLLIFFFNLLSLKVFAIQLGLGLGLGLIISHYKTHICSV